MATKADRAEHWLRQYMSQHRSAPSKDIKEAASREGISAGNLHLARQRIPEIEVFTEGYPRTSHWLYKADEPPPKKAEAPEVSESAPVEPSPRQQPLQPDARRFTEHARALIAEANRQPRRRNTDTWPLKD